MERNKAAGRPEASLTVNSLGNTGHLPVKAVALFAGPASLGEPPFNFMTDRGPDRPSPLRHRYVDESLVLPVLPDRPRGRSV